jgi:hypothetical protein
MQRERLEHCRDMLLQGNTGPSGSNWYKSIAYFLKNKVGIRGLTNTCMPMRSDKKFPCGSLPFGLPYIFDSQIYLADQGIGGVHAISG